MAIVKMNKLSIVALESEKSAIMDKLMELGTVEINNLDAHDKEWELIVEKDGDELEVSELESDVNKVKNVLDNLEKYDSSKKGLFNPKRQVSKNEYEVLVKNKKDVWNTVDEITHYIESLAALKTEENKLSNLIGTLKSWENLSVPLELTSTKYTSVYLGVIPEMVEADKLIDEVYSEVPECYINVVNKDVDQYYVLFVCHNESVEQAYSILKKSGFARVEFKDLVGTAKENITKANKRISEIKEEKNSIEKKIAENVSQKNKIELLYDYLILERDKRRTFSNFIKTEKAFLLKGWIPENVKGSVEKELNQNFNCVVSFEKPDKDEEYPVLLKNNSIVRPFEFINELYSLPSSKSFDSNWIMAPFYFVFFGLMLSDAGYGLIIALITGAILINFKLKGGIHKLIKLLFFGGISTFIWGTIFGGWFGNIFETITGGTPKIFQPIIFNPLDDPMRLLVWSLIFGAIQIVIGMALNAYELIKDGKVMDAIFDIGSWYIFLAGLTMLLGGGALGAAGKYLAIIGAVMLILTQGRHEEKFIMKVVKGVGSLYNVTGYLADILSYSRLLALGLATGVIATVVNTVGSLFGFSVVGIIIFIIVFIFGHTFNILINLLGAYVHASRLMYVEFYSKFYEGGGKQFNPFKRNTKYVEIK